MDADKRQAQKQDTPDDNMTNTQCQKLFRQKDEKNFQFVFSLVDTRL